MSVNLWQSFGLLAIVALSAQGIVHAAADVPAHADALIAGDSMMRSVERSFEKALSRRKVSTTSFASIGTGLARLDLLDWPAKLETLARAFTPKQAFIMMGTNDNQPLQIGGGAIPFGSDSWQSEYGRRVGKTMDALLDGGVGQVVWIGLPCMREERLDQDVRVINDIIANQAAARPNVTFVPTYALFSKSDTYSSYVISGNGMPVEVRDEDGIHLNRKGAELLVEYVLNESMKRKSTGDTVNGGM